jgi:hypothetical protein
MAGLVPATHVFAEPEFGNVDFRNKSGDEEATGRST